MLSVSAPTYAEKNENYSPLIALTDILIYRPLGLAVTAAGAAMFTAISPFTALAHISPPHDAFKKTSDFLILAPWKYTFARPVGYMSLYGY